jgi:hypothetical protein
MAFRSQSQPSRSTSASPGEALERAIMSLAASSPDIVVFGNG